MKLIIILLMIDFSNGKKDYCPTFSLLTNFKVIFCILCVCFLHLLQILYAFLLLFKLINILFPNFLAFSFLFVCDI